MDKTSLLVVAMAEECKALIEKSKQADPALPKALQPKHLLWMCRNIEEHAENAPLSKLHRWLGFVQCAMLANRMLDFDAAKAMFDAAKNAYGGSSNDDDDLIDHLDPSSSFKLDLGGQG